MFQIYERREDTNSQLTALFFLCTSLILSAASVTDTKMALCQNVSSPSFLFVLPAHFLILH